MDILHPRCAGLDVHRDSVVACARLIHRGRVEQHVETFGTTTSELDLSVTQPFLFGILTLQSSIAGILGRRAMRLFILSLLLPLIGAAPAPLVAADPPLRLAVVIANSTYDVLPPLSQCPLAARNVAAALRDAGFQVSEVHEATRSAEINAALANFAKKAPAQAVLITYYCGYIAVFNGRAFLVPKSAELASTDRITTEGIPATNLINVMIAADPRQSVLILDVAPAPGKSDPVVQTAFPVANPASAAAMLAISQPVPGGPGNVLAQGLRSAVANRSTLVNLQTLLEGTRADWRGQPGTITALTAVRPDNVYLTDEAASVPLPATPSAALGSVETSDVERQMSRPERRRVQARLQALGYYQGDVDAVFGNLTRDAIRRYQSAKGLPQTGRLGVTEATPLLFFDARRATR